MSSVLIFLTQLILAQDDTGAIQGMVKSEEGEPLPGAVVVIKDSELGVLTGDNGSYVLPNVPLGTHKLVVSYVGYETVEKDVSVDGIVVFDAVLKLTGQKGIAGESIPSDGSYMFSITPIPGVSIFETGAAPDNGVFASQEVTDEDIEPLNNGQDMPQLLRFTPSIVTTSDAGAGIGYTGLRIRGSDQSRINVTINGIPYNDAESQGVFWVNLPDLASSVDNISIQRGVGSSTNGPGAFGATIGINTTQFQQEAYGRLDNGYGSFNTWRHTVAFGSGQLDNGFNIEGRLSQITSDGYIDRASSELRSYYLGGQYTKGKLNVKGIMFGGKERTYQSWWGVPEVALDGTEEEIREWGAANFYSEEQTDDLVNLGRRANYYTYENEVDNYQQDHYQLHASLGLGEYFVLRASGHYTYGRGYFEQFRDEDPFSDYGFDNILFESVQQFSDGTGPDGQPINNGFESNYEWDQVEFVHNPILDGDGEPVVNDNGQTLLNSTAQITQSDVIRRRWLENDFYGAVYSLEFDRNIGNDRISAVLGGSYNEYDGDHFGEIIWMEHPNQVDYGDFYYFNNGFKTDFNTYFKVNYFLNNKLNVFGDLQYRQVRYTVNGLDENLVQQNVADSLNFFNPKFGLSYLISQNDQVYASYAVGNREPMRADFVDAIEGTAPRPETLRDLEFGYRRRTAKYNFEVNIYNMDYTDQLVLTGELNDVGTPIRTNVASSYRRGVEAQFGALLAEKLRLNLNATYSQNKIENFTEQVAAYDQDFSFIGFDEVEYEETDIAFSPEIIGAAILTYTLVNNDRHNAEVSWQAKYVGEQFLDNTSSEDRTIPAYFVNDLRVSYSLLNTGAREIRLNLLVNNVLDEMYVSNGYTYGFVFDGQRVDEDFFYPQAGRNYLLNLSLLF